MTDRTPEATRPDATSPEAIRIQALLRAAADALTQIAPLIRGLPAHAPQANLTEHVGEAVLRVTDAQVLLSAVWPDLDRAAP